MDMVLAVQGYRPLESVFEVGKKGAKTPEAILMQKRRRQFADAIISTKQKLKDVRKTEKAAQQKVLRAVVPFEVDETGFKVVGKTKKRKVDDDSEFKFSYRPTDDLTEKGYAVHAGEGTNFNESAFKATMDIVADDADGFKHQAKQKWDSKTHRFVKDQIGSDNKKRIRTENGTLVAATFKSDR